MLKSPTMKRLASGCVIFAALAAAASGDYFRSAAQRHFAATQTYEDVYYLPARDYLVLGSLGYRIALADLLWMKALVYYGEELSHRGSVKNLFRYGDAMLALDPDFKRVYRWIASSAIYRPGTITVDDARAAIRYLERATRRFPDDGELAWDLGANYTYELAALLPIGPQREAARRKGLDYLEAAVLRNAGPPWLVLQTASQLRTLGQREQAIRHLEDVYASIMDTNVKHEIELQLTRLRSATYTEALRRTNEELEAARSRDFPYLDINLYLLVGPRPPFGGDAWLVRGFDPAKDRTLEVAAKPLSD
jgi:tetratricopeptide (TPR) repeat protein